MTIIVAFVLEAFLFRMEYSKEHQDNEGGELPCLQSKMFIALIISGPSCSKGQ